MHKSNKKKQFFIEKLLQLNWRSITMQYNDIKLEIYEKASKGLITPSEKDILLTSLDEEHGFYQFCEYHGLIPVDSDDFVFESIRAAIGKFMRKSFDMKVIKDKWGKMASRFTHRWKHRILDPKTKKSFLNHMMC